jgi:hypothetical protein
MLRNFIALITSWIKGSSFHMVLIEIGHLMFPKEGIGVADINMHDGSVPGLKLQDFFFMFKGHKTGSFIQALAVAATPVSHKIKFSLGIGCFFLLGGMYMNYSFHEPIWFSVAAVVLAYIPMACIHKNLALNFSKKS